MSGPQEDSSSSARGALAPPSALSAPRIVDVVFAGTRRKAWWAGAALALTGGLHASALLWARNAQPSLESWSEELAARVHAELSRQQVIELPRPKPPEPSPVAKSTEAPVPRAQAPRAPRVANAPPPPAQAGRIVASEPAADAVDLTATTFVTGTASAYAGGTTTSSGSSATAVLAQTIEPEQAREPDRSRPVSLADDEWQCAWPLAADAEDVDEQSVMLRVSVRPDGVVASTRLVSDPGHGFGAAALVCAARTRFAPARDRHGRLVLAESPPIRVRFTR